MKQGGGAGRLLGLVQVGRVHPDRTIAAGYLPVPPGTSSKNISAWRDTRI